MQSSSKDRMQGQRNGSGFQNLLLFECVKMVQEMYSNMRFLKGDQIDTASTKVKVTLHCLEGKTKGRLEENNDFKGNIHRFSEKDSWLLGKVLCKNESEIAFV